MIPLVILIICGSKVWQMDMLWYVGRQIEKYIDKVVFSFLMLNEGDSTSAR